jgi:hypothetical protein
VRDVFMLDRTFSRLRGGRRGCHVCLPIGYGGHISANRLFAGFEW